MYHMMNLKGGTGLPFNSEIAYLGNHDIKNFVLQDLCSAQHRAKRVLLSMAMMETRFAG